MADLELDVTNDGHSGTEIQTQSDFNQDYVFQGNATTGDYHDVDGLRGLGQRIGCGVKGAGGDLGGNGVVGQGGEGRSGVVGGFGVLGHGGDSEGAGFGPGVVGIDGKNTPPADANQTKDIGVFGLGATGVVGVDENHDAPDSNARKQVGVFGVGTTGVRGTGDVGVFGNSVGNFVTSTGVVGQSDRGFGVWGDSDQSHGVYGENSASKVLGATIFDRPAGCYGFTLKNRGVAGVVGTEGKFNDPKSLDDGAVGVYGSSAFVRRQNQREPSGFDFKGWAGFFVGPVGIWGGLAVAGYKSAAVPHPDGSHRLLYSIESPESWFEDFGEARLVKGKASVKLEKVFAKLVSTDSYHVFLTPRGDSMGLYVADSNARGFMVREQQRGKSTLKFSYRIVARRKDIKTTRLAKVKLPKISRPSESASSGRKSKK
jgi:hypothetical protein